MKNILIIYFFFISLISSLYAQPTNNTGFAHPLQVEPVALYTKVRGNIGYWHKDFNGVKEINKDINVEGEYKFSDSFSVISSAGRTDYSQTDTAREITWDRWNAGIKYGKVYENGSSQFLIGAGLRLYDKKRNAEFRERENPDFYLIRPNFGLGYKYGIFQIMSEIRFQTETNRHGKESSLQEFKRYYQVGIAPSFSIADSVRIFTELEYREPVDRVADKNLRYFNFYPGISMSTDNLGTFSFSLLLGILPKEDNAIDRGIRFSYFYFFDTNQ
ncbi:hypothetical protein ND856_02850 [Leptospira bandrabouensis]|uniref:hypothetical protein n=1 Tax=Leptospira bandrabouensis TaxID=2484903 RepID=UPI001EE96E53|nr:hypothetical protein [Leptospira bandrabouensis]MCG6144000.1 hypothetical protein [Leptospira bandrabouensis]MCG6159661.1 hypothetical protein [Leptospira bandrabouensis]MCG6163594.1 hypothetical protein [Leptospira bandrabouensis]MCW7457512.1 hypothetical protein [Leptospira bandrabouensis]MCW7476212.1 hypothetical protein [Leptospira bandrabouensis]